MKSFPLLLLGLALATPTFGMDATQLTAISQKFAAESPDEQYKARLELNKLVDEATAPGGSDHAAVNRLLVEALSADTTPPEAKKYLLRVLTKVGDASAVPALATMQASKDKLLAEEARRALELIPGPEAVAALENALRESKDKVAQLGLLNSLAIHQADSSIQLVSSYCVHADADLARAAITALAGINSPASLAALAKAHASTALSATAKLEAERALLASQALDEKAAASIYESTPSPENRITAFLALVAGEMNERKQALVEQAIRHEENGLRQAALLRGLEFGVPSLRTGLLNALDKLSPGDRLVIFANVHLLQPVETAEAVALKGAESSDELERIAAFQSLGELGTTKAFQTVLQATGDRERNINQAAKIALSRMNCAEGESILLAMLKGGSKDDTVLAIRNLNYYKVTDANTILLGLLESDDGAIVQEALKSLYATANLADLKKLSSLARDTQDEGMRGRLISICGRIATRIGSDEAKALVDGLN